MARFVMHFLKKINYVATSEPFKRLIVQGMINGRTYLAEDGRYLNENQVNILNEKENRAEETLTGMPVHMEWEKMSKSKKNGVDPSELFDEYSVDTIRLIMLADVSPKSPRNWSTDSKRFYFILFLPFETILTFELLSAFSGILNWQHRIWLCLSEFNKARNDESIISLPNDDEYKNDELKAFEVRNSCLSKADYNYTNANLSTSIKACQELTDELRVRKLKNQIKILNQNSKKNFFVPEIFKSNCKI